MLGVDLADIKPPVWSMLGLLAIGAVTLCVMWFRMSRSARAWWFVSIAWLVAALALAGGKRLRECNHDPAVLAETAAMALAPAIACLVWYAFRWLVLTPSAPSADRGR